MADGRRQWNRVKRAATKQGDGRRRKKGAPAKRIIPGEQRALAALLKRHGIGVSKLRRAKVDPKEVRRLVRGELKTISADLRGRLLAAFPENVRREAAREIDDALLTSEEYACLIRARFWRRERITEIELNTPDIPMFDTDGSLIFVRPSDPRRLEQRKRDFEELTRRAHAVLPTHSIQTTGDDLVGSMLVVEQRVLAPLMEWESSGFTQRHWRELTANELLRFLAPENQYEAHSLLMSPDSALDRVRDALARRGPRAVAFRAEDAEDTRVNLQRAIDRPFPRIPGRTLRACERVLVIGRPPRRGT